MNVSFEVQLKIRKPPAEVFAAVVDPEQLSGYFVERASGPLVEGATVKWKFPEFDELTDVVVRQVIPNERIVLEWAAAEGGYDTRIEMKFVPLEDGATMVQISESGWRDDAKGRESSYSNCGGWMHMMTCMKAYLEYGVHLRAGGAL